MEIIKRRFTADDYQRMGQTGILSEDDRVELIDGEVVAMSPIGPRHSATIDRMTRSLVMIIEVAESSIDYDREMKAALYAASSVPEYWLVDLNANRLSCYSDPSGRTYRTLRHPDRGESVTPALLPECPIPVDVLLGA
jgi:Uma2 family endonuclease